MRRRIYKGIVSFIASFTMLANTYSVYANDAFKRGLDYGNNSNHNPSVLFKDYVHSDSVDKLPKFGATGDGDIDHLTSLYKSGKDSPATIDDLKQAGKDYMDSSSCDGNYYECKGRDAIYGTSNRIHSGDKRADFQRYESVAKDMRHIANSRDPYEVLGLNSTNVSGGGEVCEEHTINVPGRVERKSCFESTYRVLAEPARHPVLVDYSYDIPICTDPSYNLVSDHSSCMKVVYGCDSGDTLQGTQCAKSVGKVIVSCPVGTLGQCFGCPPGASEDDDGNCVEMYAAHQSSFFQQPVCSGREAFSNGQQIRSDAVLVHGNQTKGSVTCQTEHYSCPSNLIMNGKVCEDVDRHKFLEDPKCKNLGYDAEGQREGFLCSYGAESDCAPLESTCSKVSEECEEVDDVKGSPTYGQCIAKFKEYDCPVAGTTETSVVCGYEPTCVNGNCYEEEESHCEVPLPDEVIPTIVSEETCDVAYIEDFVSCGVNFSYSAPDEKGKRHIIGGVPAADCNQYLSNSQCTMYPIEVQVDDETGEPYWMDKTLFSCMTGEVRSTCDLNESSSNCTLKSESVTSRQFGTFRPGEIGSVFGGGAGNFIPTAVTRVYSCEKSISIPQSSCSTDFASVATALEISRQAGSYMDPDSLRIFEGEEHRCDKRKAGFQGASFGSKDCCKISAPDPNSNGDIINPNLGDAAGQLVRAGVTAASSYTYDFMMNSEKFYELGATLWEKGLASDAWTAGLGNSAQLSSGINLLSYAGMSLAYAPGVATGFGGFTATSSLALGNSGFALQFSPVGFYIYAAIKLFEAYQKALACDNHDYKTATLKKGKLCYKTRTKCVKKKKGVFGSTCTKYRTYNCCFNSKLARIINEQAAKQSHISPRVDRRKCNGLTIEQFQQIDWDRINLSEFVNDVLSESQKNLPTIGDTIDVEFKLKGEILNSATPDMEQPIKRLPENVLNN